MTGFLHELFPYIVAVYLLESLLWVRAGKVAFVRRGRGPFRRAEPGLSLAGPLPTDQVVVVPMARPVDAGDGSARADADAIDARRAVHARTDRVLIPLAGAAFATGFIALPLAVYVADPVAAVVHAVMAVLLALWIAVAVVAERALARAGVGRRDRVVALSPLVFFPPATAHAPSFVWRDLYAAFDPDAVAAALGVRSSADWDGRVDPGAAARCPSCGAQYREGFARCVDCDVELQAIAAGGPPAA